MDALKSFVFLFDETYPRKILIILNFYKGYTSWHELETCYADRFQALYQHITTYHTPCRYALKSALVDTNLLTFSIIFFQNLNTPQNSVLLNQAIQWRLIVLSINLIQHSSVYHSLSAYMGASGDDRLHKLDGRLLL